jgi:hypothetical protein
MAATVKIYEYWGAGPSSSAIPVSGARFCTADTNTPGTQYPVVRPNDGSTNRSYAKHFALYAETSAAGGISNVKWYTDGSKLSGAVAGTWDGIGMKAGSSSAYTQATGTEGTTGTESAVATTDAFTYTSAAKLSVAGSIAGGATGKISDYVVLQLSITSAAGPGTISSETMTWEYDET